ncbi:NrdR family transcriptional regulator [Corynebacterium sphenisci DSM 44792]|uniref:Transcriptional repressor NrdR n=1 Tax=Corynebacterium sphenisci DSM 44792 TaxID=1437874 RepID=A0A1L7CXQ5_9CORY|nr:transcriptional regulator NrdR [Corynebacterium sphenisci]APT90623.1 NrdR family transcriptional regulator [Corynebacterium sphenisci DSM 44792]
MHCPFCHHEQTKVVDSRLTEEGSTMRRRRECVACGKRFTTLERSMLMVVKRDGQPEEFSRDKVIRGVRRACQGRDVPEAKLKKLAQQVEETLRSQGTSQVDSNQVGLAILEPLRDLDEVGYLRFASVYKSFSSAEDFLEEIRRLHAAEARDAAGR